MKLFLIIFAVIIPNAFSESIKTVREVLILTDDNYESAITNNEYLMLDFYAPWCGPCRKLTPEYFKAAEMLHEQKSEIKLAKVNVDEEENVAAEYNVRSLPTLKFFRKGSVIEYTGGRKAEQIVKWLLKKTGAPMTHLSSVEEAQSFIDANKVAVIGFFKNQKSDGAQDYLNVANDLFDMALANVTDEAIFSAFDAKEGTIILFRQFDEPKVVFNGELTEDSIKDFIKKNSKSLIEEFHVDVETMEIIFQNTIKDFLLFFVSKDSDNFTPHKKEIEGVAKEYIDRVLFLTVDVDDEEMEPVIDEFRDPKGVPKMVLAHVSDSARYRLDFYKYEKEGLDGDSVKKFLQDYFDGKLEAFNRKKDDSNEKSDESEQVMETTVYQEPETRTESIIEETKGVTSEEVKEESEDSSSEGESNGSKQEVSETSEESQEENSTNEPEQEKKAKRSYKRAIDDSDVIKKIYKAIHMSL